MRGPVESGQYTSFDYTQQLTDHHVLQSVGSVGDAYDNALAESFVDSFKTELIADRVWRSSSQLEVATVEWVGWFNYQRLHEALGDLPPAEFEALHPARQALTGPTQDNGSVAQVAPRTLERLTAARISPAKPTGADPAEPPAPIAAAASRSSPAGLPALAVGAHPTTLP